MLPNEKRLQIDKIILELTNPKPNIELFTNYRDFMHNRHIIPYYKFDMLFLNQILALMSDIFALNGRFNHSVMLDAVKIYIRNHKTNLDLPVREQIFSLIKHCYTDSNISESARKVALTILVDLPLFPEAEKWLCKMEKEYDFSAMIKHRDFLNRILRYPVKSKEITNWILENYGSDKLCLRRAEAISWILDENPNFTIDNQTIKNDFEFANSLDIQNVSRVIESVEENQEEDCEILFDNSLAYTRSNKLCYRPYVYITYRFQQNSEPDFTELRHFFDKNIEKIKCQTMLWAIAYSRLTNKEKTKLIKRFYRSDLFASTLKIARKHKLVNLLTWLKKQSVTEGTEYHIEMRNKPIGPKVKECVLDLGIVDECPF